MPKLNFQHMNTKKRAREADAGSSAGLTAKGVATIAKRRGLARHSEEAAKKTHIKQTKAQKKKKKGAKKSDAPRMTVEQWLAKSEENEITIVTTEANEGPTRKRYVLDLD